jgi:hypothetical protein
MVCWLVASRRSVGDRTSTVSLNWPYLPEHPQQVAPSDAPGGDPASSVTPAKAGAQGRDGSRPSAGKTGTYDRTPFSHPLCQVNSETAH